MPSPRFFQHARRLPVRGGAVAHVLARDVDRGESEQVIASPAAPAVAEGTAENIAALAAMSQHPGFPGVGYSGG